MDFHMCAYIYMYIYTYNAGRGSEWLPVRTDWVNTYSAHAHFIADAGSLTLMLFAYQRTGRCAPIDRAPAFRTEGGELQQMHKCPSI